MKYSALIIRGQVNVTRDGIKGSLFVYFFILNVERLMVKGLIRLVKEALIEELRGTLSSSSLGEVKGTVGGVLSSSVPRFEELATSAAAAFCLAVSDPLIPK
jgi:hypothetical protein